MDSFIKGSRLRRENQHFFINNSEVSGVQSIQADYSNNLFPIKFLGMDCVAMAPRGVQVGQVSVNTWLITKDPFIAYTGTNGFNGYIIKERGRTAENFSFTSGYITNYHLSCSVGSIPEVSVGIDVLGNIGRIPTNESAQTAQNFYNIDNPSPELPLKITGPGNIELNFDEFTTNRVMSLDLNIAIQRNPIYILGSREPENVEINYPVEVTCAFQVEIDDYEPRNLRNFPCEPTIKNFNVKLKEYITDDEIMSITFNDMFLISESYGTSVDGNTIMNLVYRTYITRPKFEALTQVGTLTSFLWAGGVTNHSAIVKAKIKKDSSSVRVVASEKAFNTIDLSKPETIEGFIFSETGISTLSTNDRMATFKLKNLKADTQYHYAIVENNNIDINITGKFRTPGVNNFNFTFAVGGDTINTLSNVSNSETFTDIVKNDPLFFLHLGDFHYYDINSSATDYSQYRTAFGNILGSASSTRQATFYRSLPIVYTWDDHDYSTNNSDGMYLGKEAARRVYQEYVPSYKLAEGEGNVAIYHSFVIGNCKFIVTDLRSERSPNWHSDGPNKTMMGVKQKEWFKNELLTSKGKYLIFWACSVPWIGSAVASSDGWRGFSTERQELANFFKEHDLAKNMIVLCADTHNIGYDDGTNSDYATGKGAPLIVFHTGPLDQNPSSDGGPFSEPGHPLATNKQFGLITVNDDGTKMTVKFSGRRSPNNQEVFSKEIVKNYLT
jgi:phosphodiesterase/alkaline phosphatase D-like protein